MYGWIYAKNVRAIPSGVGEIIYGEDFYFYHHLLSKFPEDIVNIEKDNTLYFFDGYIYEKDILCGKYHAQSWQAVFCKNCEGNIIKDDYRGAFNGIVYKKKEDKIIAFVDQMGNRASFYYLDGDKLIVSSNINYIVEILKKENIKFHLNENAVKYMLSFGSMIDDSTFVDEIIRILPGYQVEIQNGKIKQSQYFKLDNTNFDKFMTEEAAIEVIDSSFRKAIQREFDKDKCYGYRHLVDLSGGLDSRMVCCVAHDMGYTDQLNFTYSRKGYLDFKISEKIATDLKHDYLFQPLDTCNWMYEIDENVKKSYGLIRYNSLTGGNQFLKSLNQDMFGIEHTGMVGDVILSSFYKKREEAYGKPEFGRHLYAEKLIYHFDEKILDLYKNEEVFALYTRGLLNAQGSFFIRQNYFETASPFLDVDFVKACMSIPFDIRKRHNIYIKWINRCYPGAANYGWEKWGGVKPQFSHIKYRKIVTVGRLINIGVCKILNIPSFDSMNPLDYWYSKDKKLQEYYDRYYREHLALVPTHNMREELKNLYLHGNVCEKGMVLTVLGAINCYFNEVN